METRAHLVLSGYYGCGNAGDEAVLAGTKEAFRKVAGKRVELVVLSQNPTVTQALHGLEAVPRMHLPSLKKALRQADVLLSGGGSLLQDVTSFRSLFYYLFVIAMALQLKKPVMLFAQGLGPLRHPLSRKLVRAAACRATAITVRDQESAQLLKELGVQGPPIEVTADPAFCLTPEPVEPLLQQHGLDVRKPIVGVALRQWGSLHEQVPSTHVRLLQALRAHCASQVVLLPMQQPQDLLWARNVVTKSEGTSSFPILSTATTPQQLLGAIAAMQAVVAMRLHALLFAVRAEVPPFALKYDQKIESQMRRLGLEQEMAPWRDFDPDRVAQRVGELIQNRNSLQQRLRSLRASLEKQALRNAEVALQVLEGSRMK